MELHKAIKEIVTSKGADMITNAQIINYLLDYQAFKEKPATKLILRDVINAGYGESILALQNDKGWQIKLKQYQHEFIDSCGYKEDLAVYVFDSLAYALGLVDASQEPEVKSGFNVDSFFDIPEVATQQPVNTPQNTQKQNADPTDLYTIAQSFFNEGKYQQARNFIEKAIYSTPAPPKIAHMLRLFGDILMMLGNYVDAIKVYNECFNRKALEGRYAIDILKDYLKQHKIKGYENVMFNYFFCLYGAKKISDDQWLQLVKNEALSGLMDAIRYCADNGINPVDDHYNIYFTDKGQLINGDYLYDDGTFSHEYSTTKGVIAKVILTETSDYEKSKGWTHGYIIPVQSNGFALKSDKYMWSQKYEDLVFPHSHYSIDDINHWDSIDKIESEYYIIICNDDNYPIFYAAKKFPLKNPITESSGWFLPSIHWFRRTFPFFRSIDGCVSHFYSYWTSSQADETRAVCVYFDYRNYHMDFKVEDKKECKNLLPIAAF